MRDPYRTIVVGCGGIGTWLIEGLCRQISASAPGSGIILIDGDSFEEKNRERQLFNGAGNKAVVLARNLTPQFQNLMIVGQPWWVVGGEVSGEPEEASDDGTVVTRVPAKKILQNGDVVYAVVDNNAARKVLLEAAMEIDNIDVFCAGNDDMYYGSVYHYQRRDGRDITVNPLENHPEYADPQDRNPGEMSCQERAELDSGTQLVATNMAVAAWLLGRNHKSILMGDEPDVTQIYFDLGHGLAQSNDRRIEYATTAS